MEGGMDDGWMMDGTNSGRCEDAIGQETRVITGLVVARRRTLVAGRKWPTAGR